MRIVALVALLVACKGTPTDVDQPLTLQFEATFGGAPAACGTDLTLGASTVQLADARAFVSEIEVRDAEGTWVPVALEDDGKWQNGTVALLDFENGTGGCADSGNADLNDQIVGTVASGTYDAVRFTLGVPFALNHNDSATSPAPLNAPGMFWTWQGGFKFLRVDLMVPSNPPSRWNMHIGSTGCDSASPIDAPTVECTKPNRATIVIEGVDPTTDAIQVALDALVSDVDVAANTVDTPPGCMSSPTEPDDCGPVFGAIGLDFATGACDGDCADQALFR